VEDFEMNLSTAIPITISPRPILPNLGQKPPNTGKSNYSDEFISLFQVNNLNQSFGITTVETWSILN